MVEFPPSPERHDLAALPQRRWRPTKASWAAAVSLAVLMVGGSVMWLGQAKASPSDLVRQALGAHSATLDRCYRVEIRAESGRREAVGAGLPAQPETLLWTRGDRFWNQIRVGEQLVAWGRDEQGGVWFTLSPEAGARLAREEVPEPLALACELRSLELESLLRSILADFDLRREPASGGVRSDPRRIERGPHASALPFGAPRVGCAEPCVTPGGAAPRTQRPRGRGGRIHLDQDDSE